VHSVKKQTTGAEREDGTALQQRGPKEKTGSQKHADMDGEKSSSEEQPFLLAQDSRQERRGFEGGNHLGGELMKAGYPGSLGS